ncbi:Membrane associated serine protease, rhomboid family [Poseidonocella pacifica]|uniref:Membrane associated serine protease, rhomboid family n=1 Tax=Poseidonocella pacifica TaxID=871651 RepID=A0A1I0Z0L5_9RHOB|nr:rhomboid family intramembrane serine protease [Poseidonocella pacifica]SFB18150.1 Membrane associated serine protease, rhomboid family [Poseidonocella pacifica]
MHDNDASPVNPLPPVVWALFLLIFGVEIILSLASRGLIGGAGGVGWRLEALSSYGFSNEWMSFAVERGALGLDTLKRFVTYSFVHGAFTQTLFVGVFLLALGKFVGEVFHPVALLALFILSGIGGALVFWVFGPEQGWLIGGFPSVYGLIGGFTYLMWLRLGALGQTQLMAFRLVGVLLAIQLLFGLLFGGGSDWIADLGGFATGFLFSILLAPGGLSRLLAKMRQR